MWRAEVEAWCIEREQVFEDPYPPQKSDPWENIKLGIIPDGNGYAFRSVTEAWALERFDIYSKMPEDLQRKLNNIRKMEKAFLTLSSAELKVLKLNYFQEHSNVDVWVEIGKSRNWFDERRKSLVSKVAKVLGFYGKNDQQQKKGSPGAFLLNVL